MKKRMLSLLVILCMWATFMPALFITASAATSGECGENLTWTLNSGTLTISGNGDMYDYECDNEPWYQVKDTIKKVDIKDGVTSIGENAFCRCYGIEHVTISQTVTIIKGYAFEWCSNLESVTIPRNTADIGFHAFGNCDSLKEINVDESNAYFSSHEGNLYTKEKTHLLQYAIGKENSSFSIPNGVGAVYYGAFDGCDNISSIFIPDSIYWIDDGTFGNCSNLTDISVDENNETYSSLDGNLYNKDKTAIIQYAIGKSDTEFTVPDGVASIASCAFWNANKIQRIVLPDNLWYIGYSAFDNCWSLESIVIPKSVVSIEDYAFYACGQLKDIHFTGTENEWNSINILEENDCLNNASIHYDAKLYTVSYNANGGENVPTSQTKIKGVSLLIGNQTPTKSGFSFLGWASSADAKSPEYYPGDSFENDKDTVLYAVWQSNIINVSTVEELQSTHPYSNNMDTTWIYTHPSNADNLSITFSEDTEMESGWDYIYIYDGSETEIGRYTGAELAGHAIKVFGNVIKIRLTSDSSETRYGFKVNSIDADTGNGPITNLSCSSHTKNTVTLSFSAPKESKSVTVEQSTDNKSWISANTEMSLTSYSTTATVVGLKSDTKYYFRLNVVGGAREGISNEITVSTYEHYTSEKYFSLSNGTITGYTGKERIIRIPTQINGSEVTSIGEWAFAGHSSLISITIPDSVTSIGDCAFNGCSGLTNITIPGGVTSIGACAFLNCRGLTNVTIPDSVTSIGYSAFYGCSGLTNVTIPDSVTSIGDQAFCGCSGLTNITIPDSVTNIDERAFAYCDGLTSITIPDSVTNIDDCAFRGCDGLTSITIPDSVTSISERVFENCSGLTSVTIPNSVTSIGGWAFAYCDGLTSITIPDSVTSIGECAFYDCGLGGIVMPISVTSIGDYAFNYKGNCVVFYSGNKEDFDRINLNIGNEQFSFAKIQYNSILYPKIIACGICGDDIIWKLDDKGMLKIDGTGNMNDYSVLYGYEKISWYSSRSNIEKVIIQDGVTSIGDFAFYGCSGLTSVTIPNSVTSIGGRAFAYCDGLTSITIPGGVTSIGACAFLNCRGLTSVTIPDSVTSIGYSAFDGCSGLTNVTIPESVTSIGDQAFCGCSGLTSVTIPKSMRNIDSQAFDYCENLTDVYYSGSEDDWAKINISSWNTPLTNATIHYNYNPEQIEPLVPVEKTLTVDFSGGKEILYNQDDKTYNMDQFPLCGRIDNWGFLWTDDISDEYTAHNVTIDLTLPQGFSFDKNSVVTSKSYDFDEIASSDYMGDTIYLKNPPIGKSTLNIHISGDNVQESDSTYDLEVSGYKFNESIYRANYMIDKARGDRSSLATNMEKLYVYGDTPARIFYNAGKESGLYESTQLWDMVMNTLETVDSPSSVADYAFEKKDIYSAIIMSLLESSVDYKVMGYINNDITQQSKTLFSTVTSEMKSIYNFDVLYDKNFDYTTMSDKQIKMLEDSVNKYFKTEYGNAATLAKGASVFGKVIKYSSDFQTACETISAYYKMRQLSDSMKQVLQDMYKNCPNTNLAFKSALRDCISVINESDAEFALDMAANTTIVAGKDVTLFCFDQFWGDVKTTFCVTHPAAFAFEAAYVAGKAITDVWFNADGIAENYCKLEAVIDVENALRNTYTNEMNNYKNERTEPNAKAYNSAIDIIFNMYDTDCDYATEFLDAIGEGAYIKLKSFFGDDTLDNIEKYKEQILSLQNSAYTTHEQTLTFWLYELEQEYPDKYQEYEHLIDESNERIKKKYDIACPVDVFVYDSNGSVVASVVDNVPRCRKDANITVGVAGDKKTLYMHGDNEYTIVYDGNDTGTMDIAITEYDNSNNESRNVYFNNLELSEGLKYKQNDSSENLEDNSYMLLSEFKENILPDYDSQLDSGNETHSAEITRGYFSKTMSVSQLLHSGENAEITAYIPDGYEFAGWTSDAYEDIFTDADSVTTTVCMPDYDVSITANIIECPTLSISDVTDNSITVKSINCDDIENGVIILALYDTNDKLVNIVTEDFADEVTFTNLDLNDVRIKAMLWDSIQTMKPLAKAAER